MKQLVISIIVFYCVTDVWNEHRKTQIRPGSSVIYKGEIHDIAEIEINTVTNFRTVKLDSLSSRSLPVDSVKNQYQPFWKSLFALND